MARAPTIDIDDPAEEERREHLSGLCGRAPHHRLHEERNERDGAEEREADEEDDQRATAT